MKTAQIIRRFSFDEWGGTENVVFNSSNTLLQNNINAEILATSALSGVAEERCGNLTVRRFPYFYPYFPMSAGRKLVLDKKGGNPISFGLANAVETGNFDLIHLHTGGRIGQMLAKVAARQKIPYVMSFHGGCLDIPKTEIDEMLRPIRHTLRYGGILDRLFGWRHDLIAGSSGVICVGENEYNLIAQRYPGKRLMFLPNGVDVKKFDTKSASSLRCDLNIPADRRIMLCVSRIDYQKNQLLAVRALSELLKQQKSYHLVLIGPVTSADYKTRLDAEVARLGLHNFVSIICGLGPDDPALIGAYQQSDVFVLPSRHEPFGIVVLEAWSAKLPVAAADVGGLGRLVKDHVTGLKFGDDDLAGLVKAVTALEDPALCDRLREHAYAETVQNYSWEHIGRRLAEFYREIVPS